MISSSNSPEVASLSSQRVSAKRMRIIRVGQGGFYVTGEKDQILTTVLGSCIAVCACDPVAQIGGINHFVLPSSDQSQSDLKSLAMRYGCYSIERLLNEIQFCGGDRRRLQIKVFGGANMFGGTTRIGSNNADFVESYLQREGYSIIAGDLRGDRARKLRYVPTTGDAWLKRLKRPEESIFDLELQIPAREIAAEAIGEIELFEERHRSRHPKRAI